MVCSLSIKSFCMLVLLMMSVSWTHVSGQPRGLNMLSNTQLSGLVYTGWYRVQTPVSLLINTTGTQLVTYLPSCYHGSFSAYTIELFKSEGSTKKVITSDHLNHGLDRNTRLLWPFSSLNASDSGTYRCRFQPPTTGVDSPESYILRVVVPVSITKFNLTSTVFTKTEVDAVCCAEGYPEPVPNVTANGLAKTTLTKKTLSDGGSTVCQHFELTAQSYARFEITCHAELGNYNCSANPTAAYNFCRQTRNETSFTKKITANEQYCTPSVPAQIINGSLNCTGHTFGSMCRCSKNYFNITDAVTTSCLGSGHWSSPIPQCDDYDECTTQSCENGGTCNNTVGNYTCMCAPGWKGRNCAVYDNKCATQPCKNGGICNNTVGNYTCMCALGWKGRNCTDSITEKSSSSSDAIIAGSTIGSLGMVALIGIGVYLCFYRKKPCRSSG